RERVGVSSIRVILADDHALVRAGIRSLLERLPDVKVVGEIGNGYDAVRLAGELRPDVVLMDIGMPELNGLEALQRIKREHREIQVIVLSIFSNEESVAHALRMGASGYLLKGSVPSELEVALKAVMRGESYLSPGVSTKVVQKYLERVGEGAGLSDLLTARQREVLQLVGEGKTTKEIARLLDLSVKTVERHRADLMDRLDAHDVAGLVRYAVKMKIVNPDLD
ncbi:MAG: response regulator, partial [Spirochaetia bacterium]